MTTAEFSVVLEDHYERLRRFVRSRVSNREEADDIVQEVCLRAVRRMDTIRDDTRVESWLFQIARNAIIDHYRRSRPVDPLPELLIDDDEVELSEGADLSRCLPGLFSGLAEPDRQALQLTAIDGIKQRELAEHLGISLSGAKSRVQRARKRLKELIVRCCHLEMDRLGGIIDIRPNADCQPRNDACPAGCTSC